MSSTLYTVGGKNKVYKSVDEGVNWSIVTDPFVSTTELLEGVWVVDTDTVHTGGITLRKIYKTINGGTSWASFTLPTYTGYSAGFSSIVRIKFTTPSIGMCAMTHITTGDGAFYTTADGGASWSKLATELNFNDIYFFTASHWVLCDKFGNIKETLDGGAIWTTIKNLGPQLTRIYSNGTEMYVRADYGGIFRSPDQGATWGVLTSLPSQLGFFGTSFKGSLWVESRPFSGADKYVYAGAGGNMAITNINGVAAWQDKTTEIDTLQNINDVFFLTPSIGFWCGANRTVYKTADGLIGGAIATEKLLGADTGVIFQGIHGIGTVCDVVITGTVVTDEIGAVKGSIVVTATSGGSLEYKAISSAIGYDSGWQGSDTFSNLSGAIYNIFVRQVTSPECIADTFATVETISTLTASLTSIDLSSVGANDGSIDVTVNTGSGSFSFLWNDLITTEDRADLAVGVYSVTITDLVSLEEIVLVATINDPNEVKERDIHFVVPQVNSLRFVQEVTPNCSTPETADNVLFCEQGEFAYNNKNYFQKVGTCDTLTIQFQSNMENHAVTLHQYVDDVEDSAYTPIKKVINLDADQSIGIKIQDNGDSQSRVYYNAGGAFPINVSIGDVFEIADSNDGLDGNYQILSILTDTLSASEYLVINLVYTPVAPSVLATGNFIADIVNFDIYEFDIDFSGIAVGEYYVKIRGFDSDGNDFPAISEPIDIQESFEGLHMIEFTNLDNAFDINYTTEIQHKVRVPSHMFKRRPSAQTEVLRNTDGTLVKLSAKPRRIFTLELYQLPPYLHELLALAFDHDTILVNGVRFVTEEGYGEPEYIVRFTLSNARINIEQAQWFQTYNGDDLGGIEDDQGFIVANDGFILR